jgi:hypothetical protein
VKVGVTFTFGGAGGTGVANFTALNTSSDAIVLTYYPLGANFHPRGGMSTVTDLPTMLTKTGSKPLVLQEFGYPADAQYLGSSETLMHDFTQALCDYWNAFTQAATDTGLP